MNTDPVRFGRFELQPARRRLLADSAPVELGARALDVLLALVARAGRLVSKHELLDLVWADAAVEEANLHVQVHALRRLLGREAIATVPGRGYQFVLPLQAGVAPAPSPPEAAAPLALPPLLGRDDDLAQLQALLARGGLVTITGAGGCGKTLLARHIAAGQRGPAEALNAWVDLVELTGAQGLVPAVAAAAGVQGPLPDAAALAHALAEVQGLLVLDNAEHLLEAVRALCQALRGAAPGLVLLVTSQAPLRLPFEAVHRLAGLAVPATPCTAAEALGHAAVALFVAQARQADRRFRFGDAEVDDVVAICRSLAGSALGVQLAAALLGTLPLAAVRQRLARADTGPDASAVDPAANVLRSALSWSVDLLPPAAQRVFRFLAVAQGPLPLPAVQVLCAAPGGADEGGDPGTAADAVSDLLADLVDRSLVQCEPASADDISAPETARYRLLEAPRALALEQLRSRGEHGAALERLAEALAPVGDVWQAFEWSGRPSHLRDPGLQAHRPVAADVQAAFETALTLPGVRGAALAAHLAAPMQLVALSHPREQRLAWAQAVRSCAQTPGLDARTRARALDSAATLLRHSDLAARRDALNQAASAWREAGDAFGEFRALSRAAEAAALSGQAERAAALLAQVRALEDPAWQPGQRRWRWFAEGVVAVSAGDLPRAMAAWRQQLELVGEWGSERAQALQSLANAEQIAGDAAAALPRLLEAAAVTRRLHMRSMLHAFVLPNLVAAQLALNDLPGARAAAQEGWPHARLQDADAWWADHLALLAVREGRVRTAARLLGLGDAAYARLQDERQALEDRSVAAAAAAARQALGDTAFATLRAEGGDPARAAALLAEALASADGPPPGA